MILETILNIANLANQKAKFKIKQAGAELGQAQLPIWAWLFFD